MALISVGFQDTLNTGNTWKLKTVNGSLLTLKEKCLTSECILPLSLGAIEMHLYWLIACSVETYSYSYATSFVILWLNANLSLQAKVDYGLPSSVTPTRKGKEQNSHSQSFSGVTVTHAVWHDVKCCKSIHKPQLFPGNFSLLSSAAVSFSLSLSV